LFWNLVLRVIGRLWNLVSKKKIASRDVVLDEGYMLRKCEDEASIDNKKRETSREGEV
jgi:hypothetical protein